MTDKSHNLQTSEAVFFQLRQLLLDYVTFSSNVASLLSVVPHILQPTNSTMYFIIITPYTYSISILWYMITSQLKQAIAM